MTIQGSAGCLLVLFGVHGGVTQLRLGLLLRGITPKRVTNDGAHPRSLEPGQHSSEEASQRWRAVGDTVSN